MECPKCGGKMIKRPSIGVYSCTNGKCYHNESINVMEYANKFKKQQYQARLDKVLSKFEDVERGKLIRKNGIGIFYNTEYGHFTLNDERTILSLNRVESLIKDLEANNEM